MFNFEDESKNDRKAQPPLKTRASSDDAFFTGDKKDKYAKIIVCFHKNELCFETIVTSPYLL